MLKLFHSFEKNNIRYLHFKSNTNLSYSFDGKGDFDILVDKDEIVKIEKLISDCNGKRHNPILIGDYPGIDNWLIFDEFDGTIYHLHLHYQLLTGKKYVKDYVIPWNDLLFSTRIKDPQYNIYVTNPNVELLLLAFRSVLKSGHLDYFRKLMGYYKLPSSLQKEWDDMYTKSTADDIKKYAGIICPNEAERLQTILLKPQMSYRDRLWFHRTIRRVMKVHRRYNGFSATLRALVLKTAFRIRKRWNKYMNGMAITRKTSLQGGLIIAFVGIDGAGKSSVASEIYKWMTRGKIEARQFYMGAGHKGHSSPFLIRLLKSHHRIRLISRIQKQNYNNIKRMYKYKINGGISVLDRWPQIEYEKRNDGPKIISYKGAFRNSRYLQKKIEEEKRYLGIVKTIKPDVIFRLNISLDTCMSRKPEENTNRDALKCKLQELKLITFQGANIIEIDAEQPYHEELLAIKRALWKYI